MTASIAKYHCNYCDEDIRDVRVKCSECTDFDLCLQCFSCGAAIGPHKSNHGYQLIDCGTFPIFGPPDAWQASEELALLEAVELYGFGNWDDTSIYVGKKSPDDVQRHFITFFVDGAIGRVAWSRVPGSYKITDHSCPPDGPLSPTLTTPLVPLAELSYAEQTHLGYMPNRDDYEREYDNEAESLISTLAVNTNDDEEVDLDLKLAHVDMYRRRLADRSKMKSLARDYGLVVQFYKTLTADEEFMSQVSLQPSLVPQPSSAILPVDEDTNQSACSLTSKSSSTPSKKGKNHANSNKADASSIQPSERKDQLTEKFKSFSQFQSALDQKAMFDSLKKERELKARIRDLIRYRRSGLKKIGDVPEFEAARCKREKRKEKKKFSGCNRKYSLRSDPSFRDEQQPPNGHREPRGLGLAAGSDGSAAGLTGDGLVRRKRGRPRKKPSLERRRSTGKASGRHFGTRRTKVKNTVRRNGSGKQNGSRKPRLSVVADTGNGGNTGKSGLTVQTRLGSRNRRPASDR